MGGLCIRSVFYFILFFSVKCSTDITGPQITPAGEVTVKAGRNYTLLCKGHWPVTWFVGSNYTEFTEEHLNTPGKEFKEGDDKLPSIQYSSILRLLNVTHQAVGFYRCAYNHTAESTVIYDTPSSDDKNISSVYVFVKDENHLFVSDSSVSVDYVPTGEHFTLPCRPSFPEVEVSLYKGLTQGMVDESKFRYNRHSGFRLMYDDAFDIYKCIATYNGYDVIRTFHIIGYDRKIQRPELDVRGYWQRDDTLYYVLKGETIHVECQRSGRGVAGVLKTMTPINSNLTGSIFLQRSGSVNILDIIGFSSDNEGVYSCREEVPSTNVFSPDNSVTLRVIEPTFQFLRLKVAFPEIHLNLSQKVNEIRWLVEYLAFPNPEFTWIREGIVILKTSEPREEVGRYVIEIDRQRSAIKVKIQKQTVKDVGKYVLKVDIPGTNISQSVSLQFTIDDNKMIDCEPSAIKLFKYWKSVKKIPYFTEAKLLPVLPLFKYGQPFEVLCRADGYPPPTLSLDFKICKQRDYCSEWLPTSNVSFAMKVFNFINASEPVYSNSLAYFSTKSWKGRAYTQGVFRCVADNVHGQTLGDRKLFFAITDTEFTTRDALGIEAFINGELHDKPFKRNALKLTEDDNLLLRCRANNMKTSGSINWFGSNATALQVHSHVFNISEKSYKTNYSYVEELYLTVKSALNGTKFICQDTIKGRHAGLRIIVLEPEAPRFVQKMKESYKQKVGDNLTLTCKVDGYPSPLVASNKAGSSSATSYLTVEDNSKTMHKALYTTLGVMSALLLGALVVMLIKIIKEKKRQKLLFLEDLKTFAQGDPENLNPELGLDEQADLLPYDPKFEFPRSKIIFEKHIGSGAYGNVYRATALGLVLGDPKTTVAVKMMKSRTDHSQIKALKAEVKILMHVGRHVNIVNLLGACSENMISKGELLLIVEYCKHGSVLEYMRRHRKTFINQINENDKIDWDLQCPIKRRQSTCSTVRNSSAYKLKYAKLHFSHYHTHDNELSHDENFEWTNSRNSFENDVLSNMTVLAFDGAVPEDEDEFLQDEIEKRPLCSKDLLCWSYQIANGMRYLSDRKVLHGDLAARNILLTGENVVKISDFGLAKDIYKSDMYQKKSNAPVPVKWVALEALRDGVLSTQSDVWSYGVVLWEVFSLGQNPYAGIAVDEGFIKKLEKGLRLEQPKYSTGELYHLMRQCWEANPLDRPMFAELEEQLGNIIGESQKQHYFTLNQPYEADNLVSPFLDKMLSADYASRVREKTPEKDMEGHEIQKQRISHLAMGNFHIPEEEIIDKDENEVVFRHPQKFECKSMSPTDNSGSKFTFDNIPEAKESVYLRMSQLHPIFRDTQPGTKHDSGLYSPNLLQNNPTYSVAKVDDKPNFLSMATPHPTGDVIEPTLRPRTTSETSSGIGSIEEETKVSEFHVVPFPVIEELKHEIST